MKAFSEFSDSEIKDHVSKAHKDHSNDYDANTKFLNGDHWQEGKGWAGALPSEGNKRQQAISKIKKLFTSQNVMKEITRRHKSAVLGKEPQWGVDLKRSLDEDETPKEAEQEMINEIMAALTQWWKEQEVHTVLEDWLEALLKSSRAVLRIYIPSTYLENGTIDTSGELPDQLQKIHVEVVEPNKGAVIENTSENSRAGIMSFKDDDENEIYEITYLNEEGQTIIKNLSDEQESEGLNLGGNLTMYEGSRDLFLTEQIRQQNKLLNKALTMMSNNVDSGFLERIFLNAQPPGKWEKNEETGEEEFKPAPYRVGPGTTNFINPPMIEDEEGKTEALGTANVKFREPVSNESFSEAKSEAYSAILEESHQKHALIAGDATASGEARIQALADFVMDAQNTKSTVDKAGVWLVETVMYLAFDLTSQDDKVEEYGASFNCRIDPGNIPAEMRNAIIKQVNEELLSRSTAMAMLGVDDIDAEMAKIDSAAAQALEMLRDLRNADVQSPTLTKKLLRVVIDDKTWLEDELEEGDISTIEDEIQQQIDQRTQQQDLLGNIN
ncbi:hypothetical protein [Fodinibius sp.]|uniref:hypothetical protein n=1 Tax=Fodinibius sp. TaxID=1872440 RepID=UPI002ACDDF14|nr:hypothetical protein [Fodinibius sp.]MDZ7658068.1 hypothetical protein [Fodinibius sp.]